MNKSAGSKRFPAWLRNLGWLGFVLLGTVTMLIALRAYLMAAGHRTAMVLVQQGSVKNGVAAGASGLTNAAVSRGAPVADLPMVGIYLGGDSPEREELEKRLQELRDFLQNPMLRGSRVDGVLSFRTLLARMGVNVPEAMTEAEAAAEFLKQSERFSGLLSQWREAVGKGPWDYSSVDYRFRSKVATLSMNFQNLLGTMAEARLRTGDSAGAWSDWQTMGRSMDRCRDNPTLLMGAVSSNIRREMFQAARAGMELGAWTDDQLSQISQAPADESALASMRRDLEGEKTVITEYFSHFRENQNEITAPFLDSGSTVDNIVKQISITLTTDQQISDNLA